MFQKVVLASLCLIGAVRVAGAQIDASVVPAGNRTTWAPGVRGGLPSRTVVCASVNASTFGNGSQDASAGIQASIDRCPTGQVVALSAGTFTVNNLILINKSITVRGAGPNRTTLQKTNGTSPGQNGYTGDAQPIVVIGPSRWPRPTESTARNLSSNGVKGSSSVTVASVNGLTAGQFVLIDADEYNAASWTALPNRNGAPTATTIWASDRAVFMRHNPPTQYVDDPFPDSLGWFSRVNRPINEVKEIASVSGNTVTFTTPLHIDYPLSKSPQLTRYADGHVKNAGLEELKVMGGSDGQIRFECAAYSWMKNIEDTVWFGEGVAVNNSFRVEIRDSYIHDAAYSSPGGGAYAISLAHGSSEVLIENNIIMKANKMMVARSAGAGSVVGYNYMDDGFIVYALTFHEVGLNASHMVGSHHVLFEGNEAFNYDSDNTHGNAIYMTVFRNHLTGFRRTVPGSDGARAAGLNYGSWWHSFIGNVLGVAGAMSGWVYENLGTGANPGDPFGGALPIWKLGYQGGQWDQLADPKVLSTVVRDGNFDYVTNSVQWDRTPQPLPPSLYLTSKPTFFGSNPWPWVNPSGATKLGVLPAKQRYDMGKAGPAPQAPAALQIIR